jgi:hypothetical protein
MWLGVLVAVGGLTTQSLVALDQEHKHVVGERH